MRSLFIYTSGRRSRWQALLRGESVPTELLFGAWQWRNNVDRADILELSDLRPEHVHIHCYNRCWASLTNTFDSTAYIDLAKLPELHAYDHVFACNEYVATGISRSLASLRQRPLFCCWGMGLLARVFDTYALSSGRALLRRVLGAWSLRRFLRNLDQICFLGAAEYELACKRFPDLRNRFMYWPFPIDTAFWQPAVHRSRTGPYILFVGNDRNRDYGLLLAIARAMPQIHFVFVTSQLDPKATPVNVELRLGDWKHELVTDAEMRSLFQEAILTILPVSPTLQPSGQSVAQQAMACGCPVAISTFEGLWAPHLLHDSREFWCVQSQNLDCWLAAIEYLLSSPEIRTRLSESGLAVMRHYFDVRHFTFCLSNMLERARAVR